MTKQPDWKLIANLGDVHPLEYGGYFVYVDTTGVYDPEAELLIAPDDDGGAYEVRRFSLERCTLTDGVLSDNKFHPTYPVWYSVSDTGRLADIAQACDIPEADIVAMLCSEDPIQRAHAYRAIGDYHGFDNLDSYPLTLTRAEAEARYRT